MTQIQVTRRFETKCESSLYVRIIPRIQNLPNMAGRNKLAESDKKKPVRFFVEQSVIDANGGIEATKEKCEAYLREQSKAN